MSDGPGVTIKLNVTVQVEPEGGMSGDEMKQAACKIVEAALRYSLPRTRFKPPFTNASVSTSRVAPADP